MLKQIRNHLGSFLMSLVLIVLGILALTVPELFTGTLVWVVGALLIGAGILYIIFGIFMMNLVFGSTWIFLEGIMTIILGTIITVNPEGSFKFLCYIFALWMMISGISELFSSFDIKKYGVKKWWITLIFALIYFAFALVLFIYPKETTNVLLIILGIALIIFGLFRLIDLFEVFKREKKEEKQVKYMKKSVAEMDDHIDIDFTK